MIGGPAPDGEDVFSRIKSAVAEAANQLDASDREYPLGRLAAERLTRSHPNRLQGDRASELALWCEVALDVCACDNDFGTRVWRRLHTLGMLQARWPIEAAALVQYATGCRTIDAL